MDSWSKRWVRRLVILGACMVVAAVVVLPLVAIFAQAFAEGGRAYVAALLDADWRHPLRLSVLIALIVVPLNTVFGCAAAWALAKFSFPGKNLLMTLIDIPLSVSPVISGLAFVLLFGAQGLWGPWFMEHDWQIIYALPGMVLATLFVTLPLVARELVPALQAQGTDEEEAALVLGASTWQMLWRITLPNSKWALLYGVVLCTARALGEFGAVSVVSGHIRGATDTLPLYIEILFNDYNTVAAFAVATLLACFGLVSLIARIVLEKQSSHEH